MHTFRRSWLALFGGILLLALSVSAAFGAKPSGTEGNRGQTVATFVHDVVFGDQADADDDESAEDSDSDEDADEDADSEDADEADEADEDSEDADAGR